MATVGRRGLASRVVTGLRQQTRQPDRIIICVPDPKEFLSPSGGATCEVIIGRRGLALQRNAIIESITGNDLLVFIDDDFIMADDFLAELERLFTENLEVVMATGTVLFDGIKGPGIDYDAAMRLLRAAPPPRPEPLVDVFNAYGCNMICRAAPVIEHGLRFDDNLPLYAWLEDVDFSRKLAPYGRIVRSPRLRGVHLGAKTARTGGKRLGYSQIANPLYLMRREAVSPAWAIERLGQNFVSNLVNSVRPEDWIDRRGRLHGNLIAFGDLLSGKLHPQNALRLE